MTEIRKVAGILIKDKKLLVVREHGKSVYFSPGGKSNADESLEAVLLRELNEELNIIVQQDDMYLFGSYKAEAAGKVGQMLHMDVYRVLEYEGSIVPSSEVAEVAWVTSKNEDALELGSIFEKYIIPELHAQGVID